MRRIGVAFAVVLLTATPNAEGKGKRYPNLTLSGSAILSLQMSKVSQKGTATLYAYDTRYLRRKFQKFTSLHVSGELLPRLKLDANLSDWGYSGLDKVWTLTYEASPCAISIGDMTVSIGPGPMVLFNRRLKGLKVEGEASPPNKGSKAGPLKFVYFQTRTRAETATEVIKGADSSGPYYLKHSPIIEGSEVVKVDERILKPGVDYTLDYLTGVLNFFDVVPSTSTITVSYEYIPGRSGLGKVEGLDIKGPLAEGLMLGLSVVERKPLSPLPAVFSPKEEVEEFFGADSPGPYYLAFRPIVRWSERITVDGVLQERDRDYTINYGTGMVMFTKVIPSSSLVVVRYLYRPEALPPTLGKRVASIELVRKKGDGLEFGLVFARSQGTTPSQTLREAVRDFVISPSRGEILLRLPHRGILFDSEVVLLSGRPLVRGRDYEVDYERGLIRLLRSPSRGAAMVRVLYKYRQTSPPPKGSALALFVNLDRGLKPRRGGFTPKLRLRGTLTKIDPNYSPVESTAYTRNETGLNLSAEFLPSPRAKFSLRLSRRRLESGTYAVGALGPTSPGSVTTTFDLGAHFSPAENSVLSLSVQRNATSFHGGSHRFLMVGLKGGTRAGTVQITSSLDFNLQSSTYASREGELRVARTRTFKAVVGGGGTIGEALEVSLRLSASRIKASAEGKRSIKSHSLFITATYSPADSLSASFSLALNESIGGTVSGWYSFGPVMPSTLYGFGYGGYGFFSTPTTLGTAPWSYSGPWSDVGGLGHYGSPTYSAGWGGLSSGWGETSPSGWRGRRQISSYLRRRSFSSNLTASIQYTPTPKLSLSLGFDAQVYKGASVMGEGWSRSLSLAAGYGLGRHLNLDLTGMLQETFYVDIGGILRTRLFGANLDYSPPGRPRLSLGYTLFLTDSPMEDTTGGLFGSSPGRGAGRGRTQEFMARLTWPLKGRFEAFVEFDLLKSGGVWAYKRRELSMGVEYKISEPLRLVGKWQLLSYQNLKNRAESYRASILGLQLRAQF